MPFRPFGYAVWPGIPCSFRAKKTQGMEGDFACTGGEGPKDLAENGEADTDGMTLLLLRSAATHLGYAAVQKNKIKSRICQGIGRRHFRVPCTSTRAATRSNKEHKQQQTLRSNVRKGIPVKEVTWAKGTRAMTKKRRRRESNMMS
jgi:hypothetical protein